MQSEMHGEMWEIEQNVNICSVERKQQCDLIAIISNLTHREILNRRKRRNKKHFITKANRIKDEQKYYIDLYILTLELVF